MKRIILVCLFSFFNLSGWTQFNRGVQWTKDGNGYIRLENKEIVQYSLPDGQKKVLVTATQLTPAGQTTSLNVRASLAL